MINTGEFRNLIREIVRDEIGDKSLYKIGEVASIGDKVTVIFSGEAEPSQKQYTYLKSYSPGLGDRVILMKDKGTYVVLGKIGERGGGITFGEHLAEDAADDVHGLQGKVIDESGSNSNGRYVKFSDGTQICYFYNDVGTVNITTPHGEFYGSGNLSWNFPAPFHNYPIFAGTTFVTGYIAGIKVYPMGRSSSLYRIVNPYSRTPDDVCVLLIAIGRWK